MNLLGYGCSTPSRDAQTSLSHLFQDDMKVFKGPQTQSLKHVLVCWMCSPRLIIILIKLPNLIRFIWNPSLMSELHLISLRRTQLMPVHMKIVFAACICDLGCLWTPTITGPHYMMEGVCVIDRQVNLKTCFHTYPSLQCHRPERTICPQTCQKSMVVPYRSTNLSLNLVSMDFSFPYSNYI